MEGDGFRVLELRWKKLGLVEEATTMDFNLFYFSLLFFQIFVTVFAM